MLTLFNGAMKIKKMISELSDKNTEGWLKTRY